MTAYVGERRARLARATSADALIDPLEIELTGGRTGEWVGEVGEPTTQIERLVEERVQLSVDLCHLLWRQMQVEASIRRESIRCTSSLASRGEIIRHCFARARARLRSELAQLPPL